MADDASSVAVIQESAPISPAITRMMGRPLLRAAATSRRIQALSCAAPEATTATTAAPPTAWASAAGLS